MDIQKQKLKNRLNLKFQPNVPHPSHRYSLKKISLDRKHLDRSNNDQDSQSIMLANSRNRSISTLRLPSLQKISNINAVNQISPVKKQSNQGVLNLLAAKQKIKSTSIKLNKIERSEQNLNVSINSSVIGNISKFNYGQSPSNLAPKNIPQHSIVDESILMKPKGHESLVSNKISLIGSIKDRSAHDTSILSSLHPQKPKLIMNEIPTTRLSMISKKKIQQIQAPKVKVQSKSSIHQTLTFLIKNQILTIPKIVALLQKSHSDQFLYMKVRGIYEFEVCDEHEKGKNFVTVSRNGMVIDGEMVPLETMVHEFENFKKLRKIPFFRHFMWAKFMNLWSKGSKKAHFVQNRNNIYKLLNLQNARLLKWNLQFKQILSLTEQKAGSIRQKWIYEISESIEQKRDKIMGRLARMCYETMSMFDLPISDSTELMNKVLHDLNALNIHFQVKIKIEKQLEIIYKLGRSLEFYFVYFIGEYILRHLSLLTQKIQRSTRQYCNIILKPLQTLKMEEQNYIPLKQQILINSPLNYDIEFKMEIDPITQSLVITPTTETIYQSILTALKEFYNLIEKQSFKIIRNDEFKFIQNVINKSIVSYSRSSPQDRPFTIKDYILGLKEYQPLLEDLEYEVQELQQIFVRRQQLNRPFLELYLEFKEKNSRPYTQDCFVSSLQKELQQIRQKNLLSSKIHEGEYFVFGYMDQSEVKNAIQRQIHQYEEKIFSFIPEMNEKQKVMLTTNISDHLKVLNTQITSPDVYIEVLHQSEKIQQKLPEYSSKILELQKIGELFLKICKRELSSPSYQKSLLSELRSKIKNFKERKESIYMDYRRQLELKKKTYVERIQKLSLREEEFYNRSQNPDQVHNKIKEIIKFLTKLNSQIKHFNQLQIFYNLKETVIPKLQVLIVEYESLEEIWRFYKDWQVGLENHLEQNIFKINADKELVLFDSYLRKIEKYIKNIEYFELCKYLQENILIYVGSMQFISEVQFQNLRDEDYEEMNKLVTKEWQKMSKNQPLQTDKILSSLLQTLAEQNSDIKLKLMINVRQLTLKQIIEKKLYHHKHVLEQITFKCRKQLEIKEMINGFQYWWKHLKLSYQPLDEYPLIYIFDSNDHVRREVDEYTTILLNILNHKYGAFIRKECTNHLKNMSNLTELLRLTIEHQEKFLSLYPILTSKYAQKQLMAEYKKFETILQKTMKNVRWLVKPTQSLNDQTKNLLLNHIKHFDSILKYLSDFLQKKRIKFQRFYFLQDNEMLQLLVGNENESNIFRMFEGIRGWLEDEQQIKVGVVGVGGEELKLKGWVYKNNEPESMFRSLQEAIKSNLNSIVRKTLHSYENEMKQLRTLYPKMPWMCIYTIELILYTKQIELNCFHDKISFNMQKSLIHETITAASASPKDNSNYITLLLFLLHFTEQLQRQNVTSVFHFEWYSFLKYYHEHNSVIMRCLGDQHHWGGQYQGLWNLMINTSDIRRVNTCVLSNLKNANGVLLQGPAGTGKTESLKELARCMAKYCVIFNCSNQINVQTLEKLLSGLCYTASWICLDEINRLTAQIMSVIANQISTVKNALVSGKQTFNFMGKKMQIKKGVGVFSTMNPIYLQRAKLTENLKSYFRVISVNSPDYEKILEVMLYSLNYSHASEHALKISKLFKNLSIQLGTHFQYDFGMRAIKVFVKNLSKHKQLNRKEEETIYHALYETFYSRLNPADNKTFSKVIKDILGFSLENHQVHSKFQSIKHSTQTGTIILGPTSCKTTLISEYLASFEGQKVHIEVCNTNSLDTKYLLGDFVLGRWNPGVIEILAKKSLENQKDMHVLILDNKLKSEIIQNFNTLLDESKLLTLSNGTRLKIHQNFKLLMQTPDLTMTSPATITRCHMIYVSNHNVKKRNIISSVVPNLNTVNNQRIANILRNLQIDEILRIGQIYPLLWNVQIPYKTNQLNKKIIDHEKVLNLTENQIKGLEKVIFYVIQLLALTKKVKGVITKENIVPLRRSANKFFINFEKYQEGEFVEILNVQKPQKIHFNYFIPTTASLFCEKLTKSAIYKNLSILWSGEGSNGKSTVIKRSITRAIQSLFPNERKYIKLPIDKMMSSDKITKIFDDRISVKNEIATDEIIVYVENINMCIEESEQLLRYMSEYEKLFTAKSKCMVKIPKISKIAEGSFIKGKWASRVSSHFAQIQFPGLDENEINDLYSKLIKLNVAQTKTTSFFKQNLAIEIDKISVFLNDYIKKKNKLLSKNPTEYNNKSFSEIAHFSHFQLIHILNNLRFINEKFVKDPSDLMEFLLCEIRRNEMELTTFSKDQRFKILDTLKLAFNESYKQKFQQPYNRSLKNVLGLPKQVSFFSGILTGNIEKTDWQNFKIKIYEILGQKYYLSEFMVVELIYIIRTLEYRGGNYILIGKQGLGKKNIFKMAAQVCDCKFRSFETLQEQNIAETYFAVIKQSFLRNKRTVIVIDANCKIYKSCLLFFQRLKSGYPLKFLFKSDNIDEAFSLMEHSESLNYEQSISSYEEVVDNFFKQASQKIHFFISCRSDNMQFTLRNHHNLVKNSTIRLIEDFPSDSITEISLKILEENMLEKQNAKRLSSVFLKLYQDLEQIMDENMRTKRYSYFKHNAICQFKLIEKYVEVQAKIVQKIKNKEDILNRTIIKVEQTQKILGKVKIEIEKTNEEIKKKQQVISENLPIYQDKKSNYEQLREYISLDKKQIGFKQQEADKLAEEIHDEIKSIEPFEKESHDCILSIKKGDLFDLKNSPSIHPLLRFALQNLVILFGEEENQENIKKLLSDLHLMQRLKNCTAKIQDCHKLRNRIKQREDWNFDSLSKIAFNLRYLYKFTMNTIRVSEMKHSVSEMKKKLEKMHKDISQSELIVQKKYSQLMVIEGDLNIVEQKYMYNKTELSNLNEILSQNIRKLKNADKIKKSLEMYMASWKKKINDGKQLKKNLESIAAIYAYYLKIHPFLLFEDKNFILERLKNNLQKAMFSLDARFDSFAFLKQQLADLEIQNDKCDEDSLIEMEEKKIKDLYSYKSIANEDNRNQNIIHFLNNFGQRPIIFDPDNQALKWLSKKVQSQGSEQNSCKIMITRSSFTSAQKSVELAIRQGYLLVLLIQDSFDEFTSEILNSKITHSMNRKLMEYNKNLLYIHPNFNIILCNKSRRPNPSVSYFISHQVINFQITKDFLKTELMNQILILENQKLYKEKLSLQFQQKTNTEELIKIEEQIIDSLINNKRQIIDDDKLIDMLKKGEERAGILIQNMKEINEKLNHVDNQTMFFSNICLKASDVYLSLKVMSRMSEFFSWNVQIFIKYFLNACTYSISKPFFNDQDDEDDFSYGEFGHRNLQNYEFQNYIGHGNSRATSALSYVSAVTSKVMLEDRKEDFDEEQPVQIQDFKSARKKQANFSELIGAQEHFIEDDKKGIMNKERQEKIIQRLLYYLKHSFNENEKKSWALILSLIQCPQNDIKLLFNNSKRRQDIKDCIEDKEITKNLKSVFTKLEGNSKVFANQIAIHPNPFNKYGDQFSEVQILILCKILKPERFHDLVIQLINSKGYNSILEYEKVDVSDWLTVSDCVHPILLMMGEDPLPKLTEYFGSKKYRNVILLAMGQGQSKIAEIVVEKESKKENIVIIHNLHISPQFYSFLQKTLQQFETKRPHNNFRLILIISIHYPFNISIASSCHKFLVMHPNGIGNQMQYLYENLPVELIEPNHKKLAYSICLFHSVINELQKYKSIGWTVPYEFNTADFINAIKILKELVENPLSLKHYECNIDQQDLQEIVSQDIDFAGLRYLIGEVSYVGKLANEFDRQKMRIYVRKFINSDLLETGFKYFKKYLLPSKFTKEEILKSINQISQTNPKHYGLHEDVKPFSESIESILTNLKQCYAIGNESSDRKKTQNYEQLPSINHKFEFINAEIENFNQSLIHELNQSIQQSALISAPRLGNYQLLKEIKPDTKVFDLRAFSNPQQFFIEIQKQAALRLEIEFDKVEIIWTLTPRDNIPCYGIKNLKLEGGTLAKKQNAFWIDTGKEEFNITLYLFGIQRKKKNDIQSNRKMVKIPLYMSNKRQGQINSYGDNTNLLTMVSIESVEDEQTWVLRSTAFIADPSNSQ